MPSHGCDEESCPSVSGTVIGRGEPSADIDLLIKFMWFVLVKIEYKFIDLISNASLTINNYMYNYDGTYPIYEQPEISEQISPSIVIKLMT